MKKQPVRLEIGSVHNSWTVISIVERIHPSRRHFGHLCRCICGEERLIPTGNLVHGVSKSCGCVNRANLVLRGTKPLYEAIHRSIYTNYKKQAETRGYVFELTTTEFKNLILQDCHYCGEVPSNTFKSGGRFYNGNDTFLYNGVDRRVNTIGYTSTNCVPCCSKCNFAKKDFDYDEWIQWVHRLYHSLNNSGKFNDYPKGVEQKLMLLEMGNILTPEDDDIV